MFVADMTDSATTLAAQCEGRTNQVEHPLVSVYLPTRNRPALVERAIHSVFAQTYRNVQLVVVDDASGRETVDMLERLVGENASRKSMVVLRLEHARGACVARNLALEACAGSLVTGLDDDDYFLPDRLARLVAAFDPEACSFVFDGYLRETLRRDGGATRLRIPLKQAARLRDLLKRNIVGNQVLTLTSRLRELGGFDERLPAWQDYDLWIRLVKAFGDGKAAGGISYVHTVDRSLASISGDVDKIRGAFELFLAKHAEYADRELLLCLRLAKACYGLDALTIKDLPDLIRLGEPRYVLFALYSYLTSR
jgi:glycosyltransferase involved in cell wall biosynthesis